VRRHYVAPLMQPRPPSPPLIQLAPMEGVLDWVLREMLSNVGGLDRMVTEFVRVTDRALPDHVFYKYCPELQNGGKTLAGTPVFVQLLGGQPQPMAQNAARVAELGAPGIDLNFGCPAKTVNRHDGGAALLKHPERLFWICKAVREAVPEHIPVTAKVRLGFDHKDFHREIAQAVEEGGAAHLVVHARTKTEMYVPPAHWSYVKSMSEGRAIPFLANGEIWSAQDYARCVEASGVERVALGRGLVSRPTLALEIRAAREGRDSISSTYHPIEFLDEFFNRTVAFRGPHYAIARLKQMLRYWSRDTQTFSDWFNTAKLIQNLDQTQEFFERIKKEDQWPKSQSTVRTIAPFVPEPRIC
jgi:tRNA-dihydrouridine synthase C